MIRIFETEMEVAEQIAAEMKMTLEQDENPVFCLASGSTPEKSYKVFSEMVQDADSVSKMKVVSLDEWVGIPRESEGSCYQMLNQDLFKLINLKDYQVEFFNGTSEDLTQECVKIDDYISRNPISFSLMGVGMNGHIGLNEPGCNVIGESSVVELSEKTKEVAQKYFNQQTTLEKGLTIGLNQVIGSKRVVVAITGERKAEIVKQIFSENTKKLPAHELLNFDHIDFYMDSEAAKYLEVK